MVKMTRIVAALALALVFAFGLLGRAAPAAAQTSNDEDGVLTPGEECTITSGDASVTISVGDVTSTVSVSGNADADVSGSAGGGDNNAVVISATETGGLVASVSTGAGGSADVSADGGTVSFGDTSSGNIDLVIEAGDTGIECTADNAPPTNGETGDDDDVTLPDTGVGTSAGSTSIALVGGLLALAAAFASVGLVQRRRA